MDEKHLFITTNEAKQMKKVINYKGIELVVGNRGDIWYKGKKLP